MCRPQYVIDDMILSNKVKPFGIKVTIIEPGAFRTDWDGISLRRAEVGEDYESTVGAMNRFREQFEGTQNGDPALTPCNLKLLSPCMFPGLLLLGLDFCLSLLF